MARKKLLEFKNKLNLNNVDNHPSSLRILRNEIINKYKKDFPNILYSIDFFTITGFKDLLLNEKEYHFDLKEIQDTLKKLNLHFCGFEFSSTKRIHDEIRYKDEKFDFQDLTKWHNFEKNNEEIFSGMYQFWCQKV